MQRPGLPGRQVAAVLLTTHSIVAILTVADFSNKTGAQMELSGKRRANLLSLVACVFPFLLPYFIPVILMASTTASGAEFGVPSGRAATSRISQFHRLGITGDGYPGHTLWVWQKRR